MISSPDWPIYGCDRDSVVEQNVMTINLSPQLEAALAQQARQRGVPLETVALDALQERFLPKIFPIDPRDEWERRLFGAALDCGVSVADSSLSSDGLYE
jgi:hypothetical protein